MVREQGRGGFTYTDGYACQPKCVHARTQLNEHAAGEQRCPSENPVTVAFCMHVYLFLSRLPSGKTHMTSRANKKLVIMPLGRNVVAEPVP